MSQKPDVPFERSLTKWWDAQERSFHDPRGSLDESLLHYTSPSDSPEGRVEQQAFRVLCHMAIARVSQDLESVIGYCESPIERLLLFSLLIAGQASGHRVICRKQGLDHDWGFGGPEELIIEPQAQVGEHRVDFLLERRDYGYGRWAKANLIVECDGHDFHEKTKEQAQRDKSRDRILQSCGFPVFLFTGSEVWRDAFKCAESILDILASKTEEELKELKRLQREASDSS